MPDDLPEEIDALVPLEDRDARRFVFSPTEGQIRHSTLARLQTRQDRALPPAESPPSTDQLVGCPRIDAVTVKTWAGHSNASMSLDTYGHVVIDHAKDEWRDLWIDIYSRARGTGVVGEAVRD